MREFAEMVGLDVENEEVQQEFSVLLDTGASELDIEGLRTTMIFIRCEDFCKRFNDDTVLERCRKILKDLFEHPAAPLSRGDAVLWSAAIVYAACQDENLIRTGKGAFFP
ncbi:DUF6398 domain-containing protein [Methanoculleus sp.]|uniref:DUF6398 domain-containing protein n=1 Tax=Methanoculleus sp. TaxID=90427 RepID=UPI002613BEE0|nr:DUF6398 domain-containing protein [Methanoculleus sp.]MDI6866547.1 DUF6398 domain-containing protein [Methanoculleus sp.]